jgi:hypothetical protein
MARTIILYSEAEIIALSVQCILYGFNLISVYHVLRELLFIRDEARLRIKQNINKLMVSIVVILVGFATTNVCFLLAETIYRHSRVAESMKYIVKTKDPLAYYPITSLMVSLDVPLDRLRLNS